MKEGLKAINLPFGYTTTWIVGRLEQVQGDEYILRNGRRIKDIGTKTPEDCVAEGVTDAALTRAEDREIHRLMVLHSTTPGPAWEALIPQVKK